MTEPGIDYPADPQPESRFRGPTDWCPHPGRWTSTDGASSEIEVLELLHGLVRGLQPDLVVETGSAFGYGTVALASAVERNGHGRVVSLETDEERWERALAMNSVFQNCDVLLMSSLVWTPRDGETIGLLYSDSHYDIRFAEYEHLRPWLSPGSLVVFHDTAPNTVGTNPLRDMAAADERLRTIYLRTPRGLSICEVLE